VISCLENEFPEAVFFGGDIFNEALDFASKRLKRAQLLRVNACDIPFVEEFDVIGIFDVLEHIKDDDLALRQIFKALKKGGGLILTVPLHRFLWSRFDEDSCHVRRYDPQGLCRKLRDAGFEIMDRICFVSLLFSLHFFTRLLGKRRSSKCGSEAFKGLTVPRPLNFLFGKVMNLEFNIIKSGFRFPVGSSCLLVARKPGR